MLILPQYNELTYHVLDIYTFILSSKTFCLQISEYENKTMLCFCVAFCFEIIPVEKINFKGPRAWSLAQNFTTTKNPTGHMRL